MKFDQYFYLCNGKSKPLLKYVNYILFIGEKKKLVNFGWSNSPEHYLKWMIFFSFIWISRCNNSQLHSCTMLYTWCSSFHLFSSPTSLQHQIQAILTDANACHNSFFKLFNSLFFNCVKNVFYYICIQFKSKSLLCLERVQMIVNLIPWHYRIVLKIGEKNNKPCSDNSVSF